MTSTKNLNAFAVSLAHGFNRGFAAPRNHQETVSTVSPTANKPALLNTAAKQFLPKLLVCSPQ
ncbi:hypothetical protein BUE76_04640 [Cnuella takakiae]|nr:hypothetical protein BUE76_04640 [Cnuella takakiae]